MTNKTTEKLEDEFYDLILRYSDDIEGKDVLKWIKENYIPRSDVEGIIEEAFEPYKVDGEISPFDLPIHAVEDYNKKITTLMLNRKQELKSKLLNKNDDV